MLEAIKILDPDSRPAETEEEADPMFYSYKLGTLQKAIAIFIYYNGNVEIAIK